MARTCWCMGHTGILSTVHAHPVGLDGEVYSGSPDCAIRVWSCDDGSHLRSLVGHTSTVCALAVALDGKIYSVDRTIRVWRGDNGAHLNTLVGHSDIVRALAIDLDGAVNSGSSDEEIRCGVEMMTCAHSWDTPLQSTGLVVDRDDKIYSGSDDCTMRVWRGDDGVLLQTLEGHTRSIRELVVGLDGTLFSTSNDRTLRDRVASRQRRTRVRSPGAMCQCSQRPRNWARLHAALWRRLRQCAQLVMAASTCCILVLSATIPCFLLASVLSVQVHVHHSSCGVPFSSNNTHQPVIQ
jgi:WD40 repeat protein